VIDGVVVLLLDLQPIIEQIIAESMQFGEIDSKVRHLQQVLNFFAIRIFNLDARWQHSEDHLSLGRRRHVRIARLADDVLYAPDGDRSRRRDFGESLGAVVGEVPIDLPRLAEVVRALDEHGGRPERLEAHDEMCEVKLGLEVELYGNEWTSVLGLPPAQLPIGAERRDDVLDAMAHLVVRRVRLTRVADEALVDLVLEMTDDAVAFRTDETACRRRLEPVLAPDQQVASGRVAAALLARTGRAASVSASVSLLCSDNLAAT
jgi:hypothetical protein